MNHLNQLAELTRKIDMRSSDFRRRQLLSGLSLIEVLVVIAILGVLVGMLLPAMQNMREVSRRSNCSFNLSRLSLAIEAYNVNFEHFPRGTVAHSGPIRSTSEGYHHNWIEAILPAMESKPLALAIDTRVSVYHANNEEARVTSLPSFLCPSATEIRKNTSCYAGIHASTETPIDQQNDGVFVLNVAISTDDIADGLGYTMFLGEKLSSKSDDLGWLSGTRSTLRNTGRKINGGRPQIRGPADPDPIIPPTFVGSLLSDHPGGAMTVMGSGETRFLSNSTDLLMLQQMGNRRDSQATSETGKPTSEVSPTQ